MYYVLWRLHVSRKRKVVKSPIKQKKRDTPVVTAYETKPKVSNRVKAKTPNQQLYIDAIRANKITFCSGVAGTGKTKIAVSLAVEALIDETVDKIIVTRPIRQVGPEMGHLPGSHEEKLNPYLYPIYEELKVYLDYQEILELKAKGKIQIFPLAFMRGATFLDSFIIADECQNMTKEEIVMLLTRLGAGSKMVVNGDPNQSDLRRHERGAFIHCMDKLAKLDCVGTCKLTALDVVREPIVSAIINALEMDQISS